MDPTTILIILFVAISLGFAAVFLVARDLIIRRTSPIEERLARTRTSSPISSLSDDDALLREESKPPVQRWFGQTVVGSGVVVTPQDGFLLMLFLGVAVGGAVFLWRDSLIFGLIAMTSVMFVTLLVMMILANRRRTAILEQLPDVTDFLARSVRAGESLDQAIAQAGTTIAAPLKDEFRRAARQMEMGLSLENSLRNMVRRAPMMEMRLFATSLIVQRYGGGSLAGVLERLTEVFRDRLQYRRQFQAATMGSMLSGLFITVMAVLIVCYVTLLQTDVFYETIQSMFGAVMYAVGGVLFFVGAIWILILSRSDY